MRTAHKNRQSKQVSIPKAGGSSYAGTVGIRESQQDVFLQTTLSGWISPRESDVFPGQPVPTPQERRSYPRANLRLPLRIVRISGRRELQPIPLQTTNISSSGLYARCPFRVEPGTPVHLEVELVHRQNGRGSVRLVTEAHVVRAQTDAKTGWHALAFMFDEISFERDDLPAPHFAHR